jgi:carbamoyl-phosphate synthase large subunit
MRDGEMEVAEVVEEKVFFKFGKNKFVSRHPAIIYGWDGFFDVKQAFVLECNARFGGGYPFSHIAGVN